MTRINSPARFLLILSAQSNLLRAALVTRELKIVSSAQQSFQITDNEFDPLEVWYKTKKVIAACLDIGRTQTREMAGVAIVSTDAETVVWAFQENELIARGNIHADAAEGIGGEMYRGTMRAWLLWNLTGIVLAQDTNDFGKTRIRAPFEAEIPVLAVMNVDRALRFESDATTVGEKDALIAAAKIGWH